MRFLFSTLIAVAAIAAHADDVAKLEWWQKVTTEPGHHAFTDLAIFKGQFYLCYRTGSDHGSMDGVITVLRSGDMRAWEPCATIATIGDDRDPHWAAAGDRLYLFFGVWDTIHGEGTDPPRRNKVRSHMVSTEDGVSWSKVTALYEPGWWLWRVRRIDDAFYTAAYTALRPVPEARETRLLRSDDGVHWEWVSTVTRDHLCGEADLWLQPDRTIALVSRTGGSNPARLFTSNPDFDTWTDQELSAMVHSPAVAHWNSRTFVAGRGEGSDGNVTKLWELNGTKLRELLVLPSGGDTAYPGLITVPASLQEGAPRFYISWYSQRDAASGAEEPGRGSGVYVGEITVNAIP